MKRALLLCLLLPLVAGWSCASTGGTKPEGDPAPLAQCDSKCFESCAPGGDTGVRWEGDPNQSTTTDALAESVLSALVAKVQTCDTQHRQACDQCLRRLDAQGVIRLDVAPLATPAPAEEKRDARRR